MNMWQIALGMGLFLAIALGGYIWIINRAVEEAKKSD